MRYQLILQRHLKRLFNSARQIHRISHITVIGERKYKFFNLGILPTQNFVLVFIGNAVHVIFRMK